MAKQTENLVWSYIVVPYEAFDKGLMGGRSIVFEILEGKYKGYSFVRPAQMVRKNREGKAGFRVAHSIRQVLDIAGDVVSETPESIFLRKYEKQGKKWVEIDSVEIPAPEIEKLY